LKKGILAILILIMTVSISVFADGVAEFTVTPTAEDGIVTVEIAYTNADDLCYGTIDIAYDNKKLEVVETINGDVLTEDIVVAVNEKYSEDTVRFLWAAPGKKMAESGKLYTIKFKQLTDDFAASDIRCTGFDVGNTSFEMIEDATMSVAGVEDSTIKPAEISVEIDFEEEYKKYIQSILGDDVIFIDGLEDSKTDETLPVDKAETDNKVEETTAFSDVAADDWFFESVNYAKENGLMSGVSSTEFAPEESVTRAMLVVVLHRLEGTPPPVKSSEFADVAADEWYTAGITWAAEKGIVNGVEDDKFAPDAKITREQIAAIMHRYAVYKGYDVSVGESTNILSYDDFDKISEYAIAPVQWAVGSGLVKGKTASTLNPEDNATRAEIAVILHRFIEANTK
jgi:hypothetical protein